MTATVTIRKATVDDAPDLVPVINRAFAVELEFFSTERIDLPGLIQHFEKGTILAAVSDGELVGCVYVEPKGDRSYFGLLAVDPAMQGHRIGLKLISAAEDLGREWGAGVMEIRILHLRPNLPPLYEKLGYKISRTETPPQIASAYQPYKFILMEKKL